MTIRPAVRYGRHPAAADSKDRRVGEAGGRVGICDPADRNEAGLWERRRE